MKKSGKKRRYFKRKELSYTPYLNGVKDHTGKVVIRPLTEEEKALLEQFNNEFVIGKFDEDPLHKDIIKKNKRKINKLQREDKTLLDELNELTTNTGYTKLSFPEKLNYREDTERRQNRVGEIQKRRREINDLIHELDVIKSINASNYSYKNDIMNKESMRDHNYDCDMEYSTLDDFDTDFYLDELMEKELKLDYIHFVKSQDDT